MRPYICVLLEYTGKWRPSPAAEFLSSDCFELIDIPINDELFCHLVKLRRLEKKIHVYNNTGTTNSIRFSVEIRAMAMSPKNTRSLFVPN